MATGGPGAASPVACAGGSSGLPRAPRCNYGVLGVSRTRRASCPPCDPGGRRANEWGPEHPASRPCSDKGGREEASTSPSFSVWRAVIPSRCQALVSYFWSLLRDSWRSVLFMFLFCLDSPLSPCRRTGGSILGPLLGLTCLFSWAGSCAGR